MKIAVIGTGYVGLVVGTCFAETGHQVYCADVDERKIAMLKEGKVPIYEPGLEELVKRNSAEGRLHFTTNVAEAVQKGVIVFIAVGTPQSHDGAADLKYVMEAARTVGRAMDGYRLIVDKSTVPVGTSRKVAEAVRSVTDHPFDVVSNPEFLKEGAAIEDFMKPDRVVIGTDEPRAAEIMKELYAPFVRTGRPVMVMDPESAELTKYAANAMLATRISFMNEIARICDAVGADVNRVREGIGADERIGYPFLFAGIGYGGSCFPKDVRAIIKTGVEHGYSFEILKAVDAVNEAQKTYMLAKIEQHFGRDLKGRAFAMWGLSFKPRTDDMREAPSLVLMKELLARGASIVATDPEAIEEAKKHAPKGVRYTKFAMEALDGVDALLLVTEWNEFRQPDFDEMKRRMKTPVIFDGRNIYQPRKLAQMGFAYYGVGTATRRRS